MIIGCKNSRIVSRRRILATFQTLVPYRQKVRSKPFWLSHPMGRLRRRRRRIFRFQLGRSRRHGRHRRACRRLLCRSPDRVQPRAGPLPLHRATRPRRRRPGALIRSIRVRIRGNRQEHGFPRGRPPSSPSRRPQGRIRVLRRPAFQMREQGSVKPSNNLTLLRQRIRSGCRRERHNSGRRVHRPLAFRRWISRAWLERVRPSRHHGRR